MPETIVALSLGIGLAAACGFRVFVPMFVIGLAAKTNLIPISDGFHWIESTPAIVAFGIATTLEIGAYYFPWLDNLLDLFAMPAAFAAGILVLAACMVDMPPLWKWCLAIIAGGGTAGTVKTGLSGIRLGSTTTSGGLMNPVFATIEWMLSVSLALLAVVLPLLAALVTIALLAVLIRVAIRIYTRLPRDKAGRNSR